jgi:hypothetical protein
MTRSIANSKVVTHASTSSGMRSPRAAWCSRHVKRSNSPALFCEAEM